MDYRSKHSGMSFWGIAMVAFLVGFFTLLFLKLLPPYIEHGKVRTALNNLASQPGTAAKTKAEIMESLQRRFDVDDVSRVNLKDNFTMTRSSDERTMTLRVTYEVRVPLAYNISALLEFDETAEAR